ncbi:replication protein A 32 kDa subunit-like [Dendronephthya gigantea]|uniref:replication protein A 32 kDa subunit-like n=1 Tax=Dendronephthya gigantea TaxID=151771 RepID=UPI00106BF57E|nr:replication protein A 32 kDa subunit-like [Dendronephthya gigantea]
MNWGGAGSQMGNSKMSFNSPGGGGFMNNTFGESPLSQEKREKKNLGIVPATGAMLHNAIYDVTTDCLVINKVPLNQVTYVGMVRSVKENRTHLLFELDDFTGKSIIVNRWIDQEQSAEEYEASTFREDAIVRVTGYLKRVDENKRHIVAFGIHAVKDYNELTYHMFDVIHSNLSLQKKMRENDNANTSVSGGPGGDFGNNSFSARGDKPGETPSGLSLNDNKVYQIINQDTAPAGISVMDVARRLNMPERTVRESVERLSDEGHIYSTTDDDHFRSTNAMA